MRSMPSPEQADPHRPRRTPAAKMVAFWLQHADGRHRARLVAARGTAAVPSRVKFAKPCAEQPMGNDTGHERIAYGGKAVYGARLGILMLEARFPRIPGDMGHAGTWP